MSITFTDDTPTNSTYIEVSTGKQNEYFFRDQAATLDQARTCRVSHQMATNSEGTDRHFIGMTRTDETAEEQAYVGTVHTVIGLPRKGVTSANLKLEWEKLKNKIDANWDNLMAGLPIS